MPEKKEFLLVSAIKLIMDVLPAKLRLKALLNLFYIFLNSLLELAGIAFLIPILVVILDEEKIKSNTWLQKLYTGFGFESNGSFIVFLCMMVLFFTLIKNIASLLLLRKQYSFSFSVYSHISRALFNQYYNLGLQQLKMQNSNRMVNHITSVSLMFAQNVINAVTGILNEALVFILFIIGLLWYNPLIILLITITILPFVFVFFRVIKNKMQHIGKERNNVAINQNKLLYESFQGYVDIEIKNKRNWVFTDFSSLLQKMLRLQVNNSLYLQLPLKFIEVVIVLALVIIISFGIWTHQPLERIGVLLGVFAIAAYRLLPGINRLMNFSFTLRNHVYTFEIIRKAKSADTQALSVSDLAKSDNKPLLFNHEIRINHLSFSFNDEISILKDICINIKKGETIGIIGKSGSGKSTLLNILLRFYQEKEGEISVDGQPLITENVTGWRKLIGYVPQDVFVFDGSLVENIALGDDPQTVDLNLLFHVIEKTNLTELVSGWKEGINTHIGEKGSKLSGGQKQRLGIARALYKGAEILLFDEATSALDLETEEEITNSFKELSSVDQLLTIIIIAHRYTTLKYCTRIIELNEGKITGELSYQKLRERMSDNI